MIAQTQLLVVVPTGGFNPADEFLADMAYRMLGAERAPSNRLFKKLTPEQEKGVKVEAAQPLLVELLRAIYTKDFRSVLSDITILDSNNAALSTLRCLDDAVRLNTVYACHPCDSTFYISIAAFHDYLVQEKRAEFVNLVSSLGASSITLVETNTEVTSGAIHAGIAVPSEMKIDVSAETKYEKSQKKMFDLSATFPKRMREPEIPNGLRWFARERLWQTMASSRLKDGVGSLNVAFSYRDDFNINISLATKIQGVGLNAGGAFSAVKSFEQTYRIEFHPLRP